MKKLYTLAVLALLASGINAQTLLDEGFETTSTDSYSTPIAKGDGWTAVNSYSGTKEGYNWTNYYSEKGTLTGSSQHCALCTAPTYKSDGGEGYGPREEILLSPELSLDDTYQLSFDWAVSPMAFYQNSLYDLQVRIVENDDVNNAETIFSLQSADDRLASGVEGSVTGWQFYTSKLDLSEWKGQKVKVAFVYKMYTTVANNLYLDNVSVKQHTYATTPVPTLSLDRYDYGKLYIGEKFYSEVIKLTNTGTKGLQIESVDLPAGTAINIDPKTVNLGTNESVSFQVSYTASLTSPASGNVVLHTNGGDATIAYTATKESVPDGMTEETFDAYFPPAGWTNDGWSKASQALEGDVSAMAGVSVSDNYLTSPRLDLTKGGSVQFTYYNQFDSEDGSTYQENDIKLELSTDGGKTWTSKWEFDYENSNVQNTVVTETVDLGTGTDDSYVRWHNTAVSYDTDNGAGEGSTFFLDRVLLPNVYGQDGLPGLATLVSPKDSLTDVYPRDIKLEWAPAQFATGYKLYAGSSETNYDIVNGQDLGNTLTYTIAKAPYETMVYWKVVPYNMMGDNLNAPYWHFTTQKDASTAAYPYSEDFTGLKALPAGWTSSNTSTYGSNRNWSILSGSGNPAPCLYNMWLSSGEQASVTTQEFTLPEGKTMAISFDWGDLHPNSLKTDETGLVKKNNVSPNNGQTKVTFEIFADDKWTQLDYISRDRSTLDSEDKDYWVSEKYDLGAYAGKTVMFRWTHYSYAGSDHGAGLDNLLIEEVSTNKAAFNKAGWNAGKVNYEKAVNSGNQFTLLNKGTNTLKVKSVAFDSSNFSSSLAAGTEIAPGEGVQFNIQFNALQTVGQVGDEMVVTFDNDYTVNLPVEGEALASDIFYYSFEDNTLERQWTDDFTMIDVDKNATLGFNAYWLQFDRNNEAFAYAVGYDSKLYNIMGCVSGDAALVTMGASESSSNQKGDNWLISRKLTAKSDASFEFYARNWESTASVLPSAKHQVAVLVSETSNTDTNAFTEVMSLQEIPFLADKEWKHYTVDLSAYAGKEIYVALRDYTDGTALAAFYDDVTLNHFAEDPTGIQNVTTAIDDNARVTVFSLNGVKVAEGNGTATLRSLQKGIYVVKVQDGNETRTLRVARK